MGTKLDLYDQWKRDGELDKVMNFISICAQKLVTQREMCEAIGITESTFSKLKKRHPEIQKAINDARLQLKMDLMDSLLKKAVGHTIEEYEEWTEETDNGKKHRTHTSKKQLAPDYKSIVYILTKRFGKQFSERYEELLLAEKKINESKETWEDVTSETDSQTDES